MKPAKKPTARRPRATPTTREGDAPDPTLDRAQRALVAEALRRAEATRNVVEDALVDLGRWLLVHVFADDATAALAGKRDNPVWRDLLARSGGPSLRLSRRMLYVSLAIAAHDKHIPDESWRLLEPGRKELLLPLADTAALREAAQHVVAMKLTQRDTRAYVRATLAAQGRSKRSRATVPQLRARLGRLGEHLMGAAETRRLRGQLAAMPERERTAVSKELAAMRWWLDALLAT